MTLTGQAATMLSMLLCGWTMGMLYDTYRTMERRCRLPVWLVWISDFLFWISCTFLVFGTLLRVNEGVVRIYIFLGLGMGIILYFLLFQRMYLRILNKLITFSLWLYRVTIKTAYYLLVVPLLWLYRALITVVLFLFSVLLTIGKWLFRPFLLLGSKTGNWIWTRYLQKPTQKIKRMFRKKWQTLTGWIKGKKM
ncbi:MULTISPECIES: spore cortex biosynthesis protein YabQ [Aneurinibacillus]|uniref:spore cortex biosynthesis protein YabQ n=1 Tax=Aneurinibacillus TaxID=55079 RepID=UPI0011BF107A|nr:spore cortex biosynthesis protein YabQ [Aneurinibacillus danicus]